MTQTNEIRVAAERMITGLDTLEPGALSELGLLDAYKALCETIEEDDFRIELEELVAALIPDIGDEYRATGDEDDEDAGPSMDLTIGYTPRKEGEIEAQWGYQTGDNSYTGGAYSHPHWAVVYLERESNPAEVAREIIDQIGEAIHGC